MDVTFSTPTGWFNYRVGVILLRGDRLLMAHNSGEPYYYTVGGRVQLQETSDDAVRREVAEELGVAPASQQLRFIHEQFYTLATHPGPIHEIGFYYAITMPGDWELDRHHQSWARSYDSDQPMTEWYEWLALDQLSTVPAYPRWLATELTRPWDGIRHIVTPPYEWVETAPRSGGAIANT